MKIVIFDGMSGAGKTTLRYKLFQKFDYNILTIDRFTPSMWVYEYLRSGIRRTDIFEIEEKMNLFDCNLFICLCSINDSKLRTKKDNLRSVVFNPEFELNAFNEYLNISKYNLINVLDTSKLSIDDCIHTIISTI